MGKVTFLGLLLVLVISITVTTSFVYPPPPQQAAEEKISPAISKDEQSSSSSESSSEDDYDTSEDSSEPVEDKEKMLCNVIVRATHDLHVHQSKSADEITIYLNTDCENVGNEELVEQCHEMVSQHGAEIYKHVMNGMRMSEVCKAIEDGSELALDNERPTECSNEGGDKCRCCEIHVEKRKMRFRFIVKLMAKRRMCMCRKSPRPNRCRQWVRRKERHILRKIENICPRMVCEHLGYCKTKSEDDGSTKILTKVNSDAIVGSPSLALELFDQRLEAHLTENVCDKFEQSQALCVHLAASSDSHHYTKMYMAVFHNDTKWFDNDLRKEAQSAKAGVNVNLCDACKNVIQSSKDFYLQSLETVRNALKNTCARCPAKEKCEESFNKLVDTFKTYVDSLTPDQVCSTVHLCSSSSLIIAANDAVGCVTCVQHLQPRKDAATLAINRLSAYFTDLCAKSDMPQCRQFVSEVMTEARLFVKDFDVQDTCMAMGFCGPNAARDVNDYANAFVQDIGKNVCSMLGSFDALCQQIVQGNIKQVQTVNLNATNIDDLFTHCEEETDEKNAVATTTDECPKDKEKCQCCIDRVIQKKKCAKKRVAMYVSHMLEKCKRCPAREKCEHYWEERKQCWDAKIDKICPKKVCIRMGYCTKIDTSSMCAYMGPFKEVCEQAFNTVGQLFEVKGEQPTATLARQIFAQAKVEDKKQVMVNKP